MSQLTWFVLLAFFVNNHRDAKWRSDIIIGLRVFVPSPQLYKPLLSRVLKHLPRVTYFSLDVKRKTYFDFYCSNRKKRECFTNCDMFLQDLNEENHTYAVEMFNPFAIRFSPSPSAVRARTNSKNFLIKHRYQLNNNQEDVYFRIKKNVFSLTHKVTILNYRLANRNICI